MAGRLMSRRIMGKASFAELKDSEGSFQMYINRDEVCEGEDKTFSRNFLIAETSLELRVLLFLRRWVSLA